MVVGVLQALGGLGVFILGMVIMVDGLHSGAGDGQQRLLARFTRSPLTGALTGAASTAVLQSSSATTIAAVGFVSAGLLSFPQALGIIYGANLGTTVTGWLVVFLGFKLKLGSFTATADLSGYGSAGVCQRAHSGSWLCASRVWPDLSWHQSDAAGPAGL